MSNSASGSLTILTVTSGSDEAHDGRVRVGDDTSLISGDALHLLGSRPPSPTPVHAICHRGALAASPAPPERLHAVNHALQVPHLRMYPIILYFMFVPLTRVDCRTSRSSSPMQSASSTSSSLRSSSLADSLLRITSSRTCMVCFDTHPSSRRLLIFLFVQSTSARRRTRRRSCSSRRCRPSWRSRRTARLSRSCATSPVCPRAAARRCSPRPPSFTSSCEYVLSNASILRSNTDVPVGSGRHRQRDPQVGEEACAREDEPGEDREDRVAG